MAAEDTIFELIRIRPRTEKQLYAALPGFTESSIRRSLSSLKYQGKITKLGLKNSGRWMLTNDAVLWSKFG